MSAFSFTHAPIDPASLAAPLASVAAGGFASFEGRVRDRNEGQAVVALEYEAFEALAIAEGDRIVAEATARHGALGARCVHRLGRLAVGDVAVWIGVAAVHRHAALAACRDIIDAVKHRLPIWKKEHYAGGDSGWVNCERCAVAPASASGGFDYSRQSVLPGVGADGQARLAEASVLVVGAGGLGCAALAALAGAGVGRITIVDHDRVEASNLHRQPLYARADIGRPKVEAAAERLAAYNGDIELVPLAVKLEPHNARKLLGASDAAVECTDSFAAKFLVNDAALQLGRPAVIASVYQYEGQLQVVRPDRRGSCLRCQWPEATRDGLVGNCRDAGVLGPVPAILGNLQAIEVLKLLLDLPGQLLDEILLVDFLEHGERRVRAPRDPRCAGACMHARAETEREAPAAIDLALPLAAAAAAGYRIVDIREPEECALAPLPLADRESLPLGRLLDGALNLKAGERYLLVCAHGVRSRAAAEWLRSRGSENVWSLRGGLAAQR